MRTRIAFVTAMLLLVGCAARVTPPTSPPNPDHSVTLSWQQNFADAPACTSTVTTSCLNGYSEGYLSGTTQVQLHTDSTAVCAGTTQPENCTTTFNSPLPIGGVTFYLILNYTDQTGSAKALAAITSGAVNVAADAPTGFTVTVQ